jgi:hypothetical protein
MSVLYEPYGRDRLIVFTARGARIVHGRWATGNRLLAQVALCRLITERGSLLDDPDFGLPIVMFLGEDLTSARLASIPGLIELELRKDKRLSAVTIGATLVDGLPVQTLELDMELVGIATGPFPLVARVSELGLEVLRLPEAA